MTMAMNAYIPMKAMAMSAPMASGAPCEPARDSPALASPTTRTQVRGTMATGSA